MRAGSFGVLALLLAAATTSGAREQGARDPRSRGAPIDITAFATIRDIPSGPEGLVSLEIDTAALAHSAGPARAFSDVRVVDSAGRQVPYLVERGVAPLVLDLPFERRPVRDDQADEGNVSEYRVTLPYPRLPSSHVVLTTSARVFVRRVTLGAERPADRWHRDSWFQALADVQWTGGQGGNGAPVLSLPLPAMPATGVLLRVDEGDNAPLPLTSVKLTLPAYRLRFYRRADETLRLAYGRPDLEPPHYDIQLLANDVLAGTAVEIRASAEPPGAADRSPLVSRRVFWVVLGVAVVVLLGLAARLVRQA
jgi:hypothetical protein